MLYNLIEILDTRQSQGLDQLHLNVINYKTIAFCQIQLFLDILLVITNTTTLLIDDFINFNNVCYSIKLNVYIQCHTSY